MVFKYTLKKIDMTGLYTVINNTKVAIYENKEGQFIALSDICTVFDLNYEEQLASIKEDSLLYSLSTDISVQGKPSTLFALDYKLMPGYIIQLDINLVKPENRHYLIEFKKECYKTLSDSFSGLSEIFN